MDARIANITDGELIIVLDFGGQYNQLIARRVRDHHVYCEILPYTVSLEEIKAKKPRGIILTGGPESVYLDESPRMGKELFELGIPVLGLCYGMQLMAHQLGGKVECADVGEYGRTAMQLKTDSVLYKGAASKDLTVWMSHRDSLTAVPEGFEVTASTGDCPIAGMEHVERGLYGLQFHPEVMHTEHGFEMLKNFVYEVCGCTGTWQMDSFVDAQIDHIRKMVGDGRVLLALSGGVDSAVCAAMIAKAIGKQLTCIFVDHGLMRQNEGDQVEQIFGSDEFGLVFKRINAEDRFLAKLKGVSDPEKKRKIIGEEFIRVFEEEAKAIGQVDFLAQGTIYADVVESGVGSSAVIKSHHNVGGLPEHVDFKALLEPLRDLFKDEVRRVGLELGLPEYLVFRQPFPGPGLGVRVIGALTKEKLDTLRAADAIFRQELEDAGLNKTIGQYFAVITEGRTVGVVGDQRTYNYTLALRAVETQDFMTATWSRIPYEVLDRCSSRIINEVRGIGRVVYDITSKPPATIEWE